MSKSAQNEGLQYYFLTEGSLKLPDKFKIQIHKKSLWRVFLLWKAIDELIELFRHWPHEILLVDKSEEFMFTITWAIWANVKFLFDSSFHNLGTVCPSHTICHFTTDLVKHRKYGVIWILIEAFRNRNYTPSNSPLRNCQCIAYTSTARANTNMNEEDIISLDSVDPKAWPEVLTIFHFIECFN